MCCLKRATILPALLLVTACLAAATASAEDDGKWEFHAVPYIWATSLTGDAALRGRSFDIDADFIDVLKESDSVLAFTGFFEANNGTWGPYVDSTYANLGFDVDVGPLDGELTAELAIVEFGLTYTVARWQLDRSYPAQPDAPGRQVRLDAMAGGRYFFIGTELGFNGPLGLDVDLEESWIEPIFGGRVIADLTEEIYLAVNGDIGGFGVGSDLSLNGRAVIGYRFELFGRRASALAGYRALYQDFEDSGRLEYNVVTHGPVLGLQIVF